MTPYEYMLVTRETAIYPKEVALPYLVLGLTSEIGELMNVPGRSAINENFVKEMGDNLWYAFRLFDECGIKPGETWDYLSIANRMDNRNRVALDQLRRAKPLEVMAVLFGRAATIADVVKKGIRDNAGIPQDVSRVGGNVLLLLAVLQDMCIRWGGYSLEEYAIANIEKLMSRKSRNVIRGSGDDR